MGKVDFAIEAVCQRGCQYVLDTIARLDRGEIPPGLAELSLSDRQALLAELKSIMAVYGNVCTVISSSAASGR
jgi:hypothetical protein